MRYCSILSQEELENIGFFLAITYLYAQLGLMECSTDLFFVLEKHPVKSVCEGNHSIISHFIGVLYANDMLCSSLLEYATDKLRVTRRNKDKLKFALILLYHFLKLLAADELAVTLVIFEDEEVTLTLVFIVKISAHLEIVQETVTTEMES